MGFEQYTHRSAGSNILVLISRTCAWWLVICAIIFLGGAKLHEYREHRARKLVIDFAQVVYESGKKSMSNNQMMYWGDNFDVLSIEFIKGGVHIWVKSDAWTYSGDLFFEPGYTSTHKNYWEFTGEISLHFDTFIMFMAICGILAYFAILLVNIAINHSYDMRNFFE